MADDEPMTPAKYAINAAKFIFAISPLLVLFYIVYQGFDDEDAEKEKRNKKADFTLDGHAE